MRGQRSAEPDGRHRADSAAEKNQCAYIAYFRLMAHGRVYETSLGETVNFSGARLMRLILCGWGKRLAVPCKSAKID